MHIMSQTLQRIICIIFLNPHNNLVGKYCYFFHFIVENAETWKSNEIHKVTQSTSGRNEIDTTSRNAACLLCPKLSLSLVGRAPLGTGPDNMQKWGQWSIHWVQLAINLFSLTYPKLFALAKEISTYHLKRIR